MRSELGHERRRARPPRADTGNAEMIEFILWIWAACLAIAACFFLFYLAARIFWLPFQVIGFLIDLPKLGWQQSSARHF